MDTGIIGIQHFLYVEDLKPIVYVMSILAGVALLVALYHYYRRWTYGGQRIVIDSFSTRLKNVVVYGLLQRRVIKKAYGGTMHLMIYIGIILLLIATMLRFIEADLTIPVIGTRILVGEAYLWYKLMANIGGVLLVVGVVLAYIRRWMGLTPGLPDGIEDQSILALFLFLAITGFILDSISTLAYRSGWVNGYDPIGMAMKQVFENWDRESLIAFYRTMWSLHMIIAIASIAVIPYTKLGHIVFGGIFNTFFTRLSHPAAFKPVPNVEKIVEEGGTFGVIKLVDTTWKQRMDYDACTKCARCQEVCPAYNTSKPLSPMKLILSMRNLMDREAWEEEIVPTHISPEIVWSCVTCGACVNICPVLIHHVESIIDLRRGLIVKGENVPEEILQISYNIMRTENPYGGNPFEKEEWLRSLIEKGIVEEAREGEEYDYIYWVGCSVAYDPRLRSTAEALLKVLKRAGIRVAVILEQSCCGEPARRIGDELMFAELVKKNQELLSRYKFKKILVSCPHGYNVFLREYPLYGVKVPVEHHSTLLARLLREGRIKVKRKLGVVATYHDPCYLGRWNKVYEEPRYVITQSVSAFKEMPRSRENSFCCGGGGGGAFYDIKIGKRISRVRAEEAASTGAKVLAVACPFCNIMLASEAPDFEMEVRDIAELLEEATRE